MAIADTISSLSSSGRVTVKAAPDTGKFNRVFDGMFSAVNSSDSGYSFTLQVNNNGTRATFRQTIFVPARSEWTNTAGNKWERTLGANQSLEALATDAVSLTFVCGHIAGRA